MNYLTPEQVSAASRANLETLFGLTNKAFEGLEKLVELNMQVARTALAEGQDTAKSMLAAKDAQELVALQVGLLQPAAEKAAAYSRHLYEIAASTANEVTKTAETQFAEVQRNVVATVDSAMKNAPAGSENAVALVKSAISAANSAYESVQRAARQATDMVEANVNAVTNTAVKASQSAVKQARRAANS